MTDPFVSVRIAQGVVVLVLMLLLFRNARRLLVTKNRLVKVLFFLFYLSKPIDEEMTVKMMKLVAAIGAVTATLSLVLQLYVLLSAE